jgi:hypothetical protein
MQEGCIRHQPAARFSTITRRRRLRTVCFSTSSRSLLLLWLQRLKLLTQWD